MKAVPSVLWIVFVAFMSGSVWAGSVRGFLDMKGSFQGDVIIPDVTGQSLGYRKGDMITITSPAHTIMTDFSGSIRANMEACRLELLPGMTLATCPVLEVDESSSELHLSFAAIEEKFIGASGPVVVGQGQLFLLSGGELTHCDVHPVTGEIRDCTLGGETGVPLSYGITVNKSLSHAYLTDYDVNRLMDCHLDSATGDIRFCVTGDDDLAAPWSLSLHPSETAVYALNTNATVRLCEIYAATGQLHSCRFTGHHSQGRGGIAINSLGNRVYTTDASPGTIHLYSVDPCNYRLTHHRQMDEQLVIPLSIALGSNDEVLYVTEEPATPDSSVLRCDIDTATGDVSYCRNTLTGQGAKGVVLNSHKTLAFVINYGNQVLVCNIKQDSKDFGVCRNSGLVASALAVTL